MKKVIVLHQQLNDAMRTKLIGLVHQVSTKLLFEIYITNLSFAKISVVRRIIITGKILSKVISINLMTVSQSGICRAQQLIFN